MYKTTKSLAKGKLYTYRKQYVYHTKPQKWCYLSKKYLEAIGDNTTQNTTQKQPNTENPRNASINQNKVELTPPKGCATYNGKKLLVLFLNLFVFHSINP